MGQLRSREDRQKFVNSLLSDLKFLDSKAVSMTTDLQFMGKAIREAAEKLVDYYHLTEAEIARRLEEENATKDS